MSFMVGPIRNIAHGFAAVTIRGAHALRRASHGTAQVIAAASLAICIVSLAAEPLCAQTSPAPVRITLDRAIELALQNNPTIKADRTLIAQSQALEVTANLRPNPTIVGDALFLPFFNPSNFTTTYMDNSAEFDAGMSYLFERGKKRQNRYQAAKDATSVTEAQVRDAERTVTFNVAQQFVAVLLAQSTIDLAEEDLKSFQQTVDIGQAQYKAGAISEGDFLKIRLQMLQFQSDIEAARLAKVQALALLHQLLGFISVPDNFDVEGELAYQPVHTGLDDLKALALRTRTDLLAAQRNITASQSAEKLAEANGKFDVTGTVDYTHVSDVSALSFFVSFPLQIFNRNQGEIARTKSVVTQSQFVATAASEQVISDVVNAYEGLRTNDQIIQLYQGGYLKDSKDSRDISEYAYRRGAASLLDFLDAERTYRANELAYRQTLASYMAALEQLREAVGTRSLP